MTKAIVMDKTGGPDVLKWRDVEVGKPKAGQVRLRQTAVGLNYIDVYFRIGLYGRDLPYTPGQEGAGVVTEIGRGVKGLKTGDRVAYFAPPGGGYAEERLIAADRLIKLPRAISDEQGASMMLQGMTAWFLIHRTHRVRPGDTILLHAAAGGVGTILSQWASHLGATVIGTVGSAAKARKAKAHGCTHVINYNTENFAERVRKLTKGKGVRVVYDSVGKATFEGSLDSLQHYGLMVSFGNASGAVPPFSPLLLAQKGCLYITRPTLQLHVAERPDLEAGARALIRAVTSGVVKLEIGQRYALKDAAQAHRDLEARKTTGSTILIP